jgi:hypothetical protein
MPRHVAIIEGHGARTPERTQRQRAILDAVCQGYRPLPDELPDPDRPIEAFGFSTRITAQEATARLIGLLDSADADWRDYVRVRDGWAHDDSRPVSDPPETGLFAFLQRLFNG